MAEAAAEVAPEIKTKAAMEAAVTKVEPRKDKTKRQPQAVARRRQEIATVATSKRIKNYKFRVKLKLKVISGCIYEYLYNVCDFLTIYWALPASSTTSTFGYIYVG